MVIRDLAVSMVVVGVVGDEVSIGEIKSTYQFGWSQSQHPFLLLKYLNLKGEDDKNGYYPNAILLFSL